jgi:Flp pilus assembly protein TadG
MSLGRILHAMKSGWRRIGDDRRGVAAIEFAFLAPLFILVLSGILENGLILLTQTVLDNATRDASRSILLGSTTSTSFTSAVCNGAKSMVPCGSIKVNVQSGATFSALNATLQTDSAGNMINTQFTPGLASQAVLIQVGYNRPFLIPWYGIFAGVKSELLVSTVVFKSEPY